MVRRLEGPPPPVTSAATDVRARARPSRRLLVVAAIAVACYLVGVNQHAIQNFDDLPLAYVFTEVARAHGALGGLARVFAAPELPNEYRIYSVSRSLHYLLFLLWGDAALPYYLVMSVAWVLAAVLVHRLVWGLAGDQPVALAAAALWLFSPFSFCRTFHHWSYLVWPALLLLTYLWLSQGGRLARWLALPVLLIAGLSGELTLPALLIAALLLTARHRGEGLLHAGALIATLAGHRILLQTINRYDGVMREHLTSAAPLLFRVRYFLESIPSAIGRAFHLDVTDFEPYFPGTALPGYAWREIGPAFVVAVLTLGVLYGLALRGPATSPRWPLRALLAPTLLVAALWVVHGALVVRGLDLYSWPWALQQRFGYVVLPATGLLLLLWCQRGRAWLRRLSLGLPLVFVVGWVLTTTIAVPLQAAVDRQLIRDLAAARSQGARVVVVDRPENASRLPGLMRPHLVRVDTPFGQDWTTLIYLVQKLDLQLAYRVVVDGQVRVVDFDGGTRAFPASDIVLAHDEPSSQPRRPMPITIRFAGRE